MSQPRAESANAESMAAELSTRRRRRRRRLAPSSSTRGKYGPRYSTQPLRPEGRSKDQLVLVSSVVCAAWKMMISIENVQRSKTGDTSPRCVPLLSASASWDVRLCRNARVCCGTACLASCHAAARRENLIQDTLDSHQPYDENGKGRMNAQHQSVN